MYDANPDSDYGYITRKIEEEDDDFILPF
jgi:hypothetical protein